MPAPAITGPRGARLARRDVCGFNRRAFAPHLQREVIPRPPLPAPRLETLDQTPLGNEGGIRHIILGNYGRIMILATGGSGSV